jgi:hypothetical protein
MLEFLSEINESEATRKLTHNTIPPRLSKKKEADIVNSTSSGGQGK